MIDNRCTLPHPDIENDATSLMPLNVVRSIKGIPQHLKYFLWLSFFKLSAELVVYGDLHDTMNHGAIVEPLQISISNCSSDIRSKLLRCRIRYHIKDPLVLQDNL